MNGSNLVLTRNDFGFYEKPLIKVVESSRPYCRYNEEFKQRELNTFEKTRTGHYTSNGPTIRNDGSPYLDRDKQDRQEQIKMKEKWVSTSDFRKVFKAPTKIIPQGFNSPSVPYHMHKFREENQQKWLAGSFKTASY